MTKLRVHSFSISIDGYGAGPNQGLEYPSELAANPFTNGSLDGTKYE